MGRKSGALEGSSGPNPGKDLGGGGPPDVKLGRGLSPQGQQLGLQRGFPCPSSLSTGVRPRPALLETAIVGRISPRKPPTTNFFFSGKNPWGWGGAETSASPHFPVCV